MIERIYIGGFRRIERIELPLKPLNVFIGANGSGKTSFLDVFSFLGASANGEIHQKLSEFGGIRESLTQLAHIPGDRAQELVIEIECRDSHILNYHLHIEPDAHRYKIAHEWLSQAIDKEASNELFISLHNGVINYSKSGMDLKPPSFEFSPGETALYQVPRSHPRSEEFRSFLASTGYYHSINVSRNSPVRLPQPMRDASTPGENGEDLVSCLYTLKESNVDIFEAITDCLHAAFPDFERLNFPPAAAGVLAMTWKNKSSKYPYYTHQLSDGTLRFLWLVTLLNSPAIPAITLIDEPEVSLHPELLAILSEVLREASLRSQIFVATHSDRLVRHLEPEEVVAVDVNENGAVEMNRASEFDLEPWLKEYTLDQVWQMGRIGGRS